MKTVVVVAFVSAALLPLAAQAEGQGGSRQAAGGAHMSSYVNDPNHDPHSLWSQHNRTGQILGAPMVSENAGAHPRAARPHWTAGTAPRRAR